MQTILVADDEASIRELCAMYLEQEGFAVVQAEDGEAALEAARGRGPDLIVLDLMMPKRSGYEVCRELRRESNVPILMLTARSEEVDRIVGLEMGADDYLGKPFHPRELTARVKAILRRTAGQPAAERGSLRVGALTIDWQSHEVDIGGEAIELRNKEFDLLKRLAESAGHVLTRERLLEEVWGYEFFGGTRTVDVHVNQLRRKLGERGVAIETVRGVGYKLVESGAPAAGGAGG